MQQRGILIIIHGLNEHSGRYADFARQLTSCNFGVYEMDWIGHGGSDGLHGYVPSLDHVVADTVSISTFFTLYKYSLVEHVLVCESAILFSPCALTSAVFIIKIMCKCYFWSLSFPFENFITINN